jgi:RNA-binding protein
VKIHHITIRVFCDRGGVDELREILSRLLPKGAQVEETVLEPESDGGVFKNELVQLLARLTRQADIREFGSKVLLGLDDYDRRMVLERIGEHVDDDCSLYLRLSKSEAAAGSIVLEYRDPIHVTFKLAVYPAKREAAVEAARELIDERKI